MYKTAKVNSSRNSLYHANRVCRIRSKLPSCTYRHRVKPQGVLETLNDFTTSDITYYVGKSVILFTMFYSSLNWLHYRRLRKDMEDKNDKNEK